MPDPEQHDDAHGTNRSGQTDSPQASGDATRLRCYTCFRPKADCVCGLLPSIANQTEVLLIQHRRERFHAFNTARLVRQALRNVTFVVDRKERIADQLSLKPGAGLLFPGPNAVQLDQVPAEQRPTQLVVIDGTWHQAKTVVRDIGPLRDLPRYQLAPDAPSNFRIRREPNAQALSTVEAVVAALRLLEPHTAGFDALLDAFRQMIDRQLEHPKCADSRRQRANRGRTFQNIPLVFQEELQRVVVAYGEAVTDLNRPTRQSTRPVYWVAERLVTGERFACVIRPEAEVSDELLGHWELPRALLDEAVSWEAARARWAAFLNPNDVCAVYHSGAARLLKQLNSGDGPCVTLKAIDFDRQRHQRSLEEVIAKLGIQPEPAAFPGRAGRRLANAKALVFYLRSLVSEHRLAVLRGERS